MTGARAVLAKGLARLFPLAPLGDMASFVNGTSYDVGLTDTGDTPIIRISNMTNPTSDYVRTGQTFPERFHVAPGDLLVSWSASFKAVLWTGPPGVLNQHIFNVREQPGNDRSYIRHSIEAAFDEMQRNVVGIGMMHLRRADFLGHPVPCPPADIQIAVGNYLNWIEAGSLGSEPKLQDSLTPEREIIDRISSVTGQLEEIGDLRTEMRQEVSALLASVFRESSANSPSPTPLRDLVALRPSDIAVEPDDTYHFAGVYSFGRGVFPGDRKRGDAFSYKRLTRLRTGDFVYPKLMAWEGAFGAVPESCDALVVSPEFPVFELDRDRVLPETLDTYFSMSAVWPRVAGVSKGTNVRRRRLHPETFLDFEFPLPPMEAQVKLRHFRRRLESIDDLSEDAARERDAVIASLIEHSVTGVPTAV